MKRYKSEISALINIENVTEIFSGCGHKTRYYLVFELFEEIEEKIYLTDIAEICISAENEILMNYNLKQILFHEISVGSISNVLKLEDDNKVKICRAMVDYIIDSKDAFSSEDCIKLKNFEQHTLNEILCNNEEFKPRINRLTIMIPKFIERIYPLLSYFIK